MGTSQLVGKRRRDPIDPSETIKAADDALSRLKNRRPQAAEDFTSLKHKYARECRAYYTIAALSRRGNLEESLRREALKRLFPLRSTLESSIVSDLDRSGPTTELIGNWASKSFFGVSAKQGVSIRYALASCVPTRTCGARCYGHDGRDREIHHLFRGALNFYFGRVYEAATPEDRSHLLSSLERAIAYGVKAAQEDAQHARNELGFLRSPRIRFSHLGEMVATPLFTNDLAERIRTIDSDVACVIYTRHPDARRLDRSLFVVNYTLEGDSDPRRSLAPPGARIVSSAWDGQLSRIADINFLEHHTSASCTAYGVGAVCPVTADHSRNSSCDVASCELCFLPHTDTRDHRS